MIRTKSWERRGTESSGKRLPRNRARVLGGLTVALGITVEYSEGGAGWCWGGSGWCWVVLGRVAAIQAPCFSRGEGSVGALTGGAAGGVV